MFGRGLYSLLLACGILVAGVLSVSAAQAQQASSAATLNEQQTTGRRLFNQNCALCHLPEPEVSKDPNDVGTSIGPSLKGVFGPPRSRPEALVKTFIQQGVEGKMPGFRYGLEPAEIDAVIAYLKTL
jgi:mono/diheme cytochrome c family protein